jgi:hypothetical protein
MQRVLIVAAAATTLLAACGSNGASVPESCPQGDFLVAMNSYVEGSVFIETPWEPAPDTDLAAALDNGGVACSYGIQEAEVGATILWSTSEAYAERLAQWQADGQEEVSVAGADEAWANQEIVSDAERHLWALNLLVDDVWIQINATFLPDLAAAESLVDAAIAEIRR